MTDNIDFPGNHVDQRFMQRVFITVDFGNALDHYIRLMLILLQLLVTTTTGTDLFYQGYRRGYP